MSVTSQNLVGKRVRAGRAAAKPRMTQQRLSDKMSKMGISIDRAGIAKIETGIRGVLDYEVVALARALDVRVSWLLGVNE